MQLGRLQVIILPQNSYKIALRGCRVHCQPCKLNEHQLADAAEKDAFSASYKDLSKHENIRKDN